MMHYKVIHTFWLDTLVLLAIAGALLMINSGIDLVMAEPEVIESVRKPPARFVAQCTCYDPILNTTYYCGYLDMPRRNGADKP